MRSGTPSPIPKYNVIHISKNRCSAILGNLCVYYGLGFVNAKDSVIVCQLYHELTCIKLCRFLVNWHDFQRLKIVEKGQDCLGIHWHLYLDQKSTEKTINPLRHCHLEAWAMHFPKHI